MRGCPYGAGLFQGFQDDRGHGEGDGASYEYYQPVNKAISIRDADQKEKEDL